MRVLLTGAAGFIGSHVAEALLARGDRVVGLDNFNDFYSPTLKRRNVAAVASGAAPGRWDLVEGDLLDPAAWARVKAFGPFDGIVHLAAWAGVRPSIERPGIYADVNVRGTIEVFEFARREGVQRIAFASSSSVYGERAGGPFRETDLVDTPMSPYAATKRAAELLAATWRQLHGMDIAALRYFTVYGPRQRPEMAIHRFATLLSRGEPITLYGDGSTARDYTYVADAVQGTLAALDRNRGFEIYNLGEERVTSLSRLVSLLADALGVQPRIVHAPLHPADVPFTNADVTKARERIGYAPSTPIEDGIRRFVDWFEREGVR